MTEVLVEFIDRLGGSAAADLVEQYHAEITNNGHLESDKPAHTNMDSWAVAAHIDGSCVGYMAVWPMIERGYLWISDAYVVPEHRRMGIHDMMFRKVVDQAKIEGVSQVQSGVHIDNIASQMSCVKQGRRVLAIMYAFDVAGSNV